jgi:hypothetical protein
MPSRTLRLPVDTLVFDMDDVLAVSSRPLAELPSGVVAAFPSTVEALRWLRD